ncbi:uncharacterized protein LOC143217694 [Lasioglossum baleicum]|uniref:uncharacterized protein LOC143217694 n=1 Tax=Lasioglossum baleicum TaxID=434251 RepID=UPI003FCEDEC4
MSILVKTMDKYHEWHRSYIESLQCCINYLSSAKNELSGSKKSSLTSTMCHMQTLNVSLHKRISSPHTACETNGYRARYRTSEFLSSLKASVTLEEKFMQHANEVSVKSFGTRNVALFRTSNLRQWYQRDVVPTILTSLEEFQERDSGWALSKILHLIVNFSKYQPLQAGCAAQTYLPRTIQLKKAVVNVNSKDEVFNHPCCSKTFEERKNDVSVNVFEWVRKKCVTLHLTEKKRRRHVNLLFIQNALSKHKCTKHICDRCLQYFYTQERLNIHTIDCERMNDCALALPTSEDKWLHFKNFANKEQYQQHHAFSIGYYMHCRYDESLCEYQVYREKEGCAAWFANRLYELSRKLQPIFDKTVPMNPLTEAEKLNFRTATHCHVCEKTLEENDIRVRYDAHFIIKELANSFEGRIDVLPLTKEKCISFTKVVAKTDEKRNYTKFLKFRFIDSFKFLNSSLDKKGVFPYDYLTSDDKLNDTCLPPREAFYNRLNGSDISDVDYLHAYTVWSRFTIQTLGQCVFENFRDDCIENYKLDPAHYYTLPGFAWDVMLKMTKIELELFTDVDMLLFVERGIRGGLSQCSHRYAHANNKYLSTHDSSKPSTYLMYFYMNNLYGWAMSQPLPHRDFRWVEDIDNFNVESIPIDSSVGYILEVDLEYPRDIHDAHADLPFCPSHDAATSSSQRKKFIEF